MRHLESEHQRAFFKWARLMSSKYPVLNAMFAIPNGGRRDKKTAANLKREGVLAGVWDIFLPYPNKGFGGLFIEMKHGKNRLTKSQKDFKNMLEGWYKFKVAYSWVEAQKAVLEYIDGETK